jgi:hypothetical protein
MSCMGLVLWVRKSLGSYARLLRRGKGAEKRMHNVCTERAQAVHRFGVFRV